MSRVFYLSGPMRGIPDFNFPAFYDVEEAFWAHLDSTGVRKVCKILNPARNFGGDTTRTPAEYMTVDLLAVLKADAVILLPGWEKSEGAQREVDVATWTGKHFWLALPEGDGWRFQLLEELPSKKPSPRGALLDEAKALICGDRNATYGPPTQDFKRSADALNAYGYRGPDGRALMPHDIAIFVMAVKLSRLMWTPDKRDSWADLAGYAGCGYECVVEDAA